MTKEPKLETITDLINNMISGDDLSIMKSVSNNIIATLENYGKYSFCVTGTNAELCLISLFSDARKKRTKRKKIKDKIDCLQRQINELQKQL